MLQALIVLFVAAPALVQGHAADQGVPAAEPPSWRRDGAPDMSRRRPRSPTEGAVDVRDRGRRPPPGQAGRALRPGLAGAADRLLRSASTTSDGHLHRSASGSPRTTRPRRSTPSRSMIVGVVVVALVALVLAALNRVPKGALGALVYVAGRAGVLRRLHRSGATPTRRARSRSRSSTRCPGTIRLATPLILGALAGCLCERAGVINIAIEGQFLMGAFFASVGRQPGLQRRDGAWSAASPPASRWPRCSASSRCATRSTRWCSASC